MSFSSNITTHSSGDSVSDFSATSASMAFDPPDMTDIHLFNSELGSFSTDASSIADTTHDISHDMSNYLNAFQKSSSDFNDSLLKVAKDPTAANMMASMHEVSNFDLRAKLMSKVASSGVKAIDKLTSMQ